MDGLRNYVQHRGFPIHIVWYGARWMESESRRKNRFSLTPTINVEDLEKDKKIKKPILEELKQLGMSVDLKEIVSNSVGRPFKCSDTASHQLARICEEVLS